MNTSSLLLARIAPQLVLLATLASCGRTALYPVDGDPDSGGPPQVEVCGNGLDDDADGLFDCDDPDCFGHRACRTPGRNEICTNLRDDDSDGLVDCDDPDCLLHPACGGPGEEEVCDNGRDDDLDSLIDCADSDCLGFPGCEPRGERCDNNIDDDGDGLTDCADPDCAGDPACAADTEKCGNGQDDDGDGLVDCDDPDCSGHPTCVPGQELCQNGQDDDGDFLTDCDDPDCFTHPKCKTPGVEICNNDVDDDDDGAVDCDDPDCFGLPICQPGKEDCDNEVDDDGDGAVDCADPDCADDPACEETVCAPTVDFGSVAAKGAKVTRTLSTSKQLDVYSSPCAIPGGGEVVARFELTGKADVQLGYEQLSGDHALSLFRAGVGQACNANPRGCFDPESKKSGSFSLKALEPGEYYLLAEAFAAGLEGELTVTLSTGTAQKKEVCLNGVDDDGDGAIDCADLDCALDPGCQTQLCKVDVNLGSLVLNGPPKHAQVDTSSGGNDVEETCAAGGGGDRVIRFSMPQAGGISVEVNQSGWHAFGVHEDKGPGTVCTADKGSCFDSFQKPAFHIAYGSMAKGVYYYVVDGMSPGQEGPVSLTFRAYDNRGPELCANEIDDDGDGLTDCMDPDCAGVIGCPGPVCAADYKAGVLVPNGPSVQIKTNTKTANNDQTVPCALGGGKDVVVELELSAVSGLEVHCSQTGDHVLGLFSAGDPRDPCDKNSRSCADLSSGPFGCDFIFPNLQPGKYFIVVEAFKPGSEGTLDLWLQALPDHAQEICNNGIDDDNDGKIDCQDANCAATPLCQGATCTPDQKLGLLPIGGGKQNVAVTTSGAGDSNSAGCALGGGEDAVVGFSLATAASLSIDFAQFGNHALALFESKGGGFSCDAAPVGCQATNSLSVGNIAFGQLPPGEYYLVVEAMAAGGEGSLVMQIAAQ